MNNYKFKGFFRILLALILVAGGSGSLFNILALHLQVNAASQAVTIDAGTEHEYVVPADSTQKYETELAEGYVQGDLKKSNFMKKSLNSYSGEVNSTISGAVQLSDGHFLSVLHVKGQAAANQPIETIILVKTDVDGEIQDSKILPTNVLGFDYQTAQESSTVGEFARPWLVMPAGDTALVYYNGQAPGGNTVDNRIAKVDNDLNISYTTVNQNNFVPEQLVEGFEYMQDNGDGLVFSSGYYYSGSPKPNKSSIEIYFLDNDSKYSSMVKLAMPPFSEIFPEAVNPLMQLQPGSFRKIDTGYVGIFQTYDLSTGKSRFAVGVWDLNGNRLQTYIPSQPTTFSAQIKISDNQSYYFFENTSSTKLRKMDIVTGAITDVMDFPAGTSITIESFNDTVYDTEYKFYGSTTEATGPFEGYGSQGGAISGTMNADFSVFNANIISANGVVDQRVMLPTTDPAIYFTGGRTSATDFAKKPTDGWEDTEYHAYFGSLKLIDDYAPGIQVGDPVTVNKDTISDWDSALLSGVLVNDIFDLNPNEGNHNMDWLRSRLNRNPLDIGLPYDWTALGLDKTQVGPNQVTYFVTDGSLQTSADSKIVNVVANTTKYDTDKKLALDAGNFNVTLAEAASLTLPQTLDAEHGHIKAWDMLGGNDAIEKVTVNTTEYQAITSATVAGVYPLTYSLTSNGVTVNNTIKVFVTDETSVVDEENDVVLFANNFSVALNNAAAFDSDAALNASAARAYAYSTGEQYPVTSLSADVSAIQAATASGPVQVVITYSGTQQTTTSVTASVMDDDTDTDPGQTTALHAKNFTLSVDAAATLSAEQAKTAADVRAWNMNTGAIFSDAVTVDAAQLQVIKDVDKAGLYPLTFTAQETASSASVTNTITVFVTDENTKISDDVILFANDFTMQLEDAATATSESLKNLSAAKAYKVSTAEQLPDNNITADTTAVTGATAAGPVNVSITYSDGTVAVTTVVASLIDEHTVVSGEEAIYAVGFKVAAADVASLNDESIKSLAHAKAWNTKSGATITVSVNSSIQAAPGAYPVVFATDAGTSVTVMVTVYDDDTVIDDAKGEAVYAHSFTVDISEVDALTEAKVRELAEAKAWQLSDGDELGLTVNYQDIQKKAGIYNVTFTTDAGTVRTVKATVKDENTVIANQEALYAESFKLSISEVATLDKATVDAKAHAKAWKLADGTPVAFDTNFSNVTNTAGVYTVTFTTDAGTTRTVYVSVYDDDTVIDDVKGEAIYAHDFTLSVAEASAIDKTLADTKAGAKAWKLSDGNALSFTTNVTAVQAVAGHYPVTFTTAQGTTITVTASVTDDDTVINNETGEAIYAHNFVLDKSEVSSLNTATVLTKAGAKAWKLHGGAEVDLNADYHAVQAVPGAYPVVLTTEEGTSRTIIVTVGDEHTIINPEKDEAIYALPFVAGTNEVAGLNKTLVDTKAGAKAWKLSDGTAIEFNTNYAQIQPVIGSYPVTFATVAGGTNISVFASIVDADTVYDVDYTAALHANSFSVPLADVATLSETIVKDGTHAAMKAWNMNSGADITAQVSVDADELNAIKSATTAQPYSLTFTVTEAGATVTKTIPVFVTDAGTEVDEAANVVLYANNFTMQLDAAASATSAQVKTLANAKAFKYTTGAPLADANISADVSGLHTATVAGPVNTAITYTDGAVTTKVVVASLIDDETVVDDENGEALYAHNFTADVSEVAGFSKSIVDTKAGAKAWKLSDGSSIDFTTNYAAVQALPGTYPVRFTTTNDLKRTIYVTITDEDTEVDPQTDTAIYAHNFTIDASEVDALTVDSVNDKAGAKVWKPSDGTALGFSTNYSAVQAKTGVYPVTFTGITGFSKTIQVTVADEYTIIDVDKDTALRARSFTINKADVASLNEAQVITLAEAEAWKLSDGSSLDVTADYTAIEAKVGVYSVKITSETGVEKTVYASVVDDNTYVDEDKDTALYAENFAINQAEAEQLDQAGVLSRSRALAWRLNSGEVLGLTVDMSGFEAKPGVYQMVIEAETGVKKSIYVSVIDDNTVINGAEALYAHNFQIESSAVADLNESQVKLLAEAQAWNIDNGSAVDFAVDYSQVVAIPGSYTVIFETAAGTQKTIIVTVTDNHTIIDGDKALYAHSFTVDMNEVASLDETAVLAKAEARAWNINTLAPITVTADFSAIKARAGAYPVVIATADGLTMTVYASVLDTNTLVVGDVAVRANNFDLLVSQVAGLNDKQVRQLAGFEAWLISGGQDISGQFTVDYSQVLATVGSYAVVFDGAAVQEYSGDNVSKTVIANIVADPVNPDLPITGSHEFAVAIAGLLSVIAGAALIIRRKK